MSFCLQRVVYAIFTDQNSECDPLWTPEKCEIVHGWLSGSIDQSKLTVISNSDDVFVGNLDGSMYVINPTVIHEIIKVILLLVLFTGIIIIIVI